MSYVSPGDGIVSQARIRELLSFGGEYDDLDFKEFWNLSDKNDVIKLAKIAIAMTSCPNGGYILIGVSDNGKVVGLPSDADESLFDSSKVGAKLNSYNSAIRVACNVITINDLRVAAIYVRASEYGFSVTEKESNDGGVTFKRGEIFIRKNTSSERPNQHDINAIVKRLLDGNKIRFEKNFDPKDYVNNQLSLKKALTLIEPDPYSPDSLEGKSILVNALTGSLLLSDKSFDSTLKVISNWYIQSFGRDRLDQDEARIALQVILAVHATGALAIRANLLEKAIKLANVSVPVMEDSRYIYGSWIRHGQVMASRADVFTASLEGDVSLISLSMKMSTEFSNFTPDYDDIAINAAAQRQLENATLGFDLLWNVVLSISGLKGRTYPSFMFYEANRLTTFIESMIEHYKLFNTTKENLKQSLSNVLERAFKADSASPLFDPSGLIEKFSLPKAQNE